MIKAKDKKFFENLINNDSLWPFILKFNVLNDENSFKLPSPFESLKPWLYTLNDSARLRDESLAIDWYWDFSLESSKLALLNAPTLTALAKIVGVALHAKELAQLIDRKSRLEISDELGADLFNFALMRGQYLVGSVALLFKSLDLDQSLSWRCCNHGWLALKLCATDWPQILHERFLNKLTVLAAANNQTISQKTISLSSNDAHLLWLLLKKCLLREVAPSWANYFTSQEQK